MTVLLPAWRLDREVVVVKVIDHPRAKVFAAWMDPAALEQWYGPAGLTIETHEADLREGGVWRFDMVGCFEGEHQPLPNLMRWRSYRTGAFRWTTACPRLTIPIVAA